MGVTTKRQDDRPVAIDLFSGAGGLSLGFTAAGFRVAAAVEIDPIHAQTHRKNFPDCVVIENDIQSVPGAKILKDANIFAGDVDVVIGGPPCQGFSAIGQRRADDPRNQLVFEFGRIVRELRPRYFVLENVRGLLFPGNRPIVDAFVAEMEAAGYDLAKELRVLNAVDFGVPQKRQRAFLIGYRLDASPIDYPASIPDAPPTVESAIADLMTLEGDQSYATEDRAPRLTPESHYLRRLEAAFERSRPDQLRSDTISGCLRPSHNAATIDRFTKTLPGEREKVSRYQRLAWDGQSPTLRAGTGSDRGSYMAARPIHPEIPRCITVREAARLHSYPDWFEFHPTRWHGFRQVGNSVPPLLARNVGIPIYDIISLGKPE